MKSLKALERVNSRKNGNGGNSNKESKYKRPKIQRIHSFFLPSPAGKTEATLEKYFAGTGNPTGAE